MGERKLSQLICLVLVAVLVGGCGGGDDGEDGSSAPEDDAEETTTTTAVEDNPAATGTTIGGGAATRTPEAQEYVDALTTATEEAGGMSESPDQNRCFNEAYVDAVGVEALADAMPAEEVAETRAITPDDIGVVMTPEQQDAFFAGLQRCIDVKAFFVAAFTTGVDMSEADAACLAGAMDENAARTMAVAAFDGNPEPIENDQAFVDVIGRLSTACPGAMEAAGWT